MGYASLSAFQIKANFLASARKKRLKKFKNNQHIKELHNKREHVWGGFSFETYKKCSITLRKQEGLDIITNQNLTRDTTILWHTTGESVRAALRQGQLNPQALTSKAIKAIGTYAKKTAERELKSRIRSFLHAEKAILVEQTQNQIEHLQGLERQLGVRIYQHSAVSFVQALLYELDVYLYKQTVGETAQVPPNERSGATQSWQRKFHATRLRSLEASQAENRAAATRLKQLILQNQNNVEWLQTHADQEILSFLKGRILSNTREMQAMNQILTYQQGSRANLRGDLNSYAEDAIKIVRDHSQDLHNPVTHDHQLAYDPDQKVTVDSEFHTDGSLKEHEELLLIVSQISGDNQPLEDIKGAIKVTSATKWRHLNSYYDANPYEPSIFNSVSHFLGSLGNLLLSPLSLLEAAIRGNEANIVAKCRYELPENEERLRDKIDYYALTARMKKQTSTATAIGLELYKAFNYLLVEGLWRGLGDGWKQVKRLPEDLSADFQNSEVALETVISELREELKRIEKHEEEILASDPSLLEFIEEAKEEIDETIYYAQPELPLTPYVSRGIINGAVSGFTEFMDFFGHNMFAKHPFTSTVSLAGSAISFMAFFAKPLAVQLFGEGYVQFLQNQGYIWTKSQFSASMAGSFTNFKLIGVMMEGIEHGPDSWLSRGLGHFIDDPAKVITYITLAWAMGHALLHLVEIPGLSEELRNHIGNPPQLTEIFGGAKLGIVAHHLLSNPQKDSEETRKNYIAECLSNFRKLEKERGRVVAPEEERWVEACLGALISPHNITTLPNQIVAAPGGVLKQPEAQKLALLLELAAHKEKLSQLSPSLKAKLQYNLGKITSCKEDARAIDHYIDPEKYATTSTLRRFLGQAISYIPTLLRCILSPLAGFITGSFEAMARPWKDLFSLFLNDLTSIAYAFSRFVNKIIESVFNRIPRTLADVFVNGLYARTASFFGFHGATLAGYRLSATYDVLQEEGYANTTGRVLNHLASINTSPNPELSLRYALGERMRESFVSEEKIVAPSSQPTLVSVAEQLLDLGGESAKRSSCSLA